MSNLESSKVRHDLRGCLNAIQLNVEALKITVAADDDAREFLSAIASEVARADRVLQTEPGNDQTAH